MIRWFCIARRWLIGFVLVMLASMLFFASSLQAQLEMRIPSNTRVVVADEPPEKLAAAKLAKADFARHCNEFANEWNDVFNSYQRSGENVWDVKRAHRMEQLFDSLRKDPSWKTR